ncbi:MAG TPA: methylenetetrahydrofolate reductase [Myxococcota bacterium]|nr:methylenetetrahydrofolate reductase [Myxococcota bacterium]
MRIAELYLRKRPVFSFEFFPPQTDAGVKALFRALGELAALGPDFVSVTCPLDKPRRPQTFALVARIQRELGLTAMAHLVTVRYARDEVRGVLEQLSRERIENLLALRGDLPPDEGAHAARDFPHASDLAGFAREFGFSIGGAAHPERHPNSSDWEVDLAGARHKCAAGCEFLITQLFFDNADYFAYVERARAAGIGVPIVPGIMPVTSVAGIKRMAAMNGNRLPETLAKELDRVEGDDAAVAAVGVQWATAQCEELLARGVPGVHFFTLNRSPATREILTALRAKGAA